MESSVFTAGKVRGGNAHKTSNTSRLSRGDSGFKGKLKAAEKAEAGRRKIKKTSQKGPAMTTGDYVQTILVPLVSASGHRHKKSLIDSGGKVKGLKNSVAHKKTAGKRKKVLEKIHKGNFPLKKVSFGAVKKIKGAAADKGARSMVKDDFDGQMVMGKKISLRGISRLKTAGTSTIKGIPKISAGVTPNNILSPLKTANIKGALKKGQKAAKERKRVKKGLRAASASKPRSLMGANISEGSGAKEGRTFQDKMKSGSGDGAVKVVSGLRIVSSVSAGRPHGQRSGQGRKAVFSDSVALLNVSAPAEPTQSRSRVSPANLKGAAEVSGGEIIKQAGDGLVMSLRKGEREIVLNLEPAELGHLEIKVMLHHGLVDASILVENADVMTMLKANTVVLEEQLAGQGFMLGGLDVALKGSDTPPRQKGEQFGDNGSRYGRGGRGLTKAAHAVEEMPLAVKTLKRPMPRGVLDLFI